ncbi:uncharacterized protein LOC117898297 [Drosophila subobscura]|uniref:uncharacterized protein LOC117898297 n=1 Tax=Drosophila subobscura TaxID=7241 RepID=UPI00155A3E0F|nr:uncharacterized protein LOC117898297 [Drosophila subobscura]
MRANPFACVFFGVWIAFHFGLNDAVIFKFTNFVCESYNKSWFVFQNCRLKALSRNKVLFNMKGTVLHPATNITLHIQVLKRANGYKPWLVDVHVDACRFLRKRSPPVVNLIYGLFKEFTNINHTCPFMGPQIVKDFYLKPELLRLPIPTGDYMLTMQWYFDKKIQFDTNVSFMFVEDLINRN